MQTTAPNVRAGCAAARRHLSLKFTDSKELFRSGGEDSLHRVHLAGGTIVEVTVVKHCVTEVHGTYEG